MIGYTFNGHDARLRPLPRSQVRSHSSARLLLLPGVLRISRRSENRLDFKNILEFEISVASSVALWEVASVPKVSYSRKGPTPCGDGPRSKCNVFRMRMQAWNLIRSDPLHHRRRGGAQEPPCGRQSITHSNCISGHLKKRKFTYAKGLHKRA